MKTLIPSLLLAFGLPALAQIRPVPTKPVPRTQTAKTDTHAHAAALPAGTVTIRQYVRGDKVLPLHDLHKFRDAPRVVEGVMLQLDRVYGHSTAKLVLNGVTVAKDDHIHQANHEEVKKLMLPFKVIADKDLKAELHIKGDLALRSITLVQCPLSAHGSDPVHTHDDHGHDHGHGQAATTGRETLPGYTPLPGSTTRPARPRLATNCTDRLLSTTGTRWATRSSTKFLETPQRAGQAGKGAVDGWDYPERGAQLDGQDAVLHKGFNNALSIFPEGLLTEKYDRLKDVRLEFVGEGTAEVSLAIAPFKDGPARTIRLTRRGAVLDVRGLNLNRSALKHFEIVVRGKDGIRIDGVRVIATVQNCTVTRVTAPSAPPPTRDIYSPNFRSPAPRK